VLARSVQAKTSRARDRESTRHRKGLSMTSPSGLSFSTRRITANCVRPAVQLVRARSGLPVFLVRRPGPWERRMSARDRYKALLEAGQNAFFDCPADILALQPNLSFQRQLQSTRQTHLNEERGARTTSNPSYMAGATLVIGPEIVRSDIEQTAAIELVNRPRSALQSHCAPGKASPFIFVTPSKWG